MKEKVINVLKGDIELALIVFKINDEMIFKEKGESQVRNRIKLSKKENTGVYTEIIKK